MELIFKRIDKKAMNLTRKQKKEIKAMITKKLQLKPISNLKKIPISSNGREYAIYCENLDHLNPMEMFENEIIQKHTNYFCGMFEVKKHKEKFVFIVKIGELLHHLDEYKIYPAVNGKEKLLVKLLN